MKSYNFLESYAFCFEQQIELLELKKEHIENLISMCRGLKTRGVRQLDFTAFDTGKLDEYAKRAKEQRGNTPEFGRRRYC